jgi:hypothetical protein
VVLLHYLSLLVTNTNGQLSLLLSFTYIELMDKTTYLNHYYFITIISFVLLFLPANCYFSVDAYKMKSSVFQKNNKMEHRYSEITMAIVYFTLTGKAEFDWLIEAMPLKIWLPNNSNLPLIGSLLNENWVHYAFSWTGAIYDLGIVFYCSTKEPDYWFYFSSGVSHLDKILFPIGVFHNDHQYLDF